MIDLHIHSKYSDGDLSIEQIGNAAKNKDIKILSITDHDSIESSSYIKNHQLSNDIIFIPGIEMSTESYYFGNKTKIHLLGYNYENNSALNDALSNIYLARYFANKEYVSKLISACHYLSNEMFHDFDYGKYGWISKKIINQVLPLIPSDKVAQLQVYLKEHKIKYIKYNFNVEEAIELIKQAEGYPIIAHPFELKLDNNKLETLLQYLIDCGLIGIETYHNNSTLEESTFYHSLAIKYNLYETGGSDFHSYTNNQEIGCKYNKLNSENILIKKLVKENRIVGGHGAK